MTDQPAVHRGRMLACAACLRPVPDADGARLRVSVRREGPAGHATHHMSFHPTCAEKVYAGLREHYAGEPKEDERVSRC